MPWKPAVCALLLVGGCWFDADYSGGTYRCTDGRCPTGRVCNAEDRCVVPGDDGGIDAPKDAATDAMIDARQAALTCVDPGPLAATGGTAMGSTVGGISRVSSMCGGFVMNGADNVYRLTAAAGDQFLISITGLRAYVITPCSITPSTPICLGNAFASAGNPIAVTTTFAGGHFIVVDHEAPAMQGAYTLTVTRP